MTVTQYGTTLTFASDTNLVGLGEGNFAVYDDNPGTLYAVIGGVKTQIANTGFQASDMRQLSDGAYLLTRQQYPQQTQGGAHFEVLNPDGSVRTPDSDVASGTGYALGGPDGVAVPGGGFVVAYTDYNNPGATGITFARTPDNTATSAAVGVAPDVGYLFFTPSGGSYVPGPSSVANTGPYSISGASTDHTAFGQTCDGAATLSTGTVVLAYLDPVAYGKAGGGYGTQNEITLRLVTPAGASGPVQVDTNPITDDPFAPAANAVRGNGGVQLVALGPSGFAAIWHQLSYVADASAYGGYRADGYDTEIRYFDNSGSALTNPQTIIHRDATFGNNDPHVAATSLGDGRIALVYKAGQDGANGQILGEVIGPFGTSVEGFAVTPLSGDGNGLFSWNVASTGNGLFAVSYAGFGNIGSHVETFATGALPGPTVAFDPGASFSNPTTPTLAGTVSSVSGTTSVEILNAGTDLGAATVNGDGTWSFTADLGPGDFNALSAVATDASGTTSSAVSPYELVTGIRGAPYRAQEYDYAADGSLTGFTNFGRGGAAVSQSLANGDGSNTIFALADGQTLTSQHHDTITGGGVRETFQFVPHFGRDEVTDFVASGAGHDILDLAATRLTSLAEVLRNTTMSGTGAVIHVSPRDTVVLDGISKAELQAHQKDFAFG